MLVAVRHHGQETRALDGCGELALENRTRAGQAGGRDFAVFADEIAQDVDVFVVDLNHASDCEAAKALAFEELVLCGALLVFVEGRFFTECGHGSYPKTLSEINVCDVKYRAFAIFGGGKEAFEFRNLSDIELGQRFCCGAKRDGFDG